MRVVPGIRSRSTRVLAAAVTCSIALAVALLAVLPATAEAQPPGCGGGPCVTVSPASRVVDRNINPLPDTVLAVDVTFCHAVPLNWSTRSITLNGVDISGTLSHTTSGYGTCAYGGRSWGSITLTRASEGVHTLDAAIEDTASFFGGGSATYEYRWPGWTRPTYQVRVAPADAMLERLAGTSGHTTSFTIRNVGSRPDTFTVAASCPQGVLSCTRTSPAKVWLDTTTSGRSATATLSFSADTASRTRPVRIVVTSQQVSTVRDSAETELRVVAPQADGTPGLVLASRPDLLAPSLCVSFPTGAAAGSVCGNLVTTHTVPGVITRNTPRAPALLYNADLARPRPILAVDYTPLANGQTPSSVQLVLRVAGTQVASSSWAAGWAPAKTRRLAVTFDANAYATGIYAYAAVVTATYSGTTRVDSLTGSLVIVNRAASPFGAGWWVAGLERLVLTSDTTRILHVGGDGSARIFVKASGDSIWDGPALAEPDSIVRSGAWYVRRLSSGATLRYDSTGAHRETVSRLGDTTRFVYTSGRLARIEIPRWHADSAFRFDYTGGTLDSIRSPAPGGGFRRTRTTVSGGLLTKIVEPSGDSLLFTYGSGLTAGRMLSRRNRLGVTTHYRYDAGARLAADSLPMPAASPIVTTYRAAESQGLAAVSATAQAPDSVYTRHDGPRTDVADVTRFWLNALGAPLRIRDALGRETTVRYEDTRFPALATSTRPPGGTETVVRYTARALPDTLIARHIVATGDSARTTYQWHGTMALPTEVKQGSGSDTVLTLADYDSVGNVTWRQVGRDTLTRVRFDYYAADGSARARQLRATSLPGVSARDSIVYDTLRGNVVRVKDRRGTWSSTRRDRLGR